MLVRETKTVGLLSFLLGSVARRGEGLGLVVFPNRAMIVSRCKGQVITYPARSRTRRCVERRRR